MATEQTITVRLRLKEGQEPYQLLESKSQGDGHYEYPALQHFFEDAGYVVEEILMNQGPEINLGICIA